jgi:hypothetical protein
MPFANHGPWKKPDFANQPTAGLAHPRVPLSGIPGCFGLMSKPAFRHLPEFEFSHAVH